MLILGLDTAGSACSVALWRDDVVIAAAQQIRPHGHAEILLPMITQVLAEAGCDFDQVDRFAVTVGPGAFTGLRIGLATARGLALATGKPALGVTTFAAMAHSLPLELRAGSSLMVIAVESRRQELYLQAFTADLAESGPPVVLAPDAVLGWLPPGPVLIAGDGAPRLRAPLADRPETRFAPENTGITDPAVVARLAATGLAALPPRPLYLRPPDVSTPSPPRSPALAPALAPARSRVPKARWRLRVASVTDAARLAQAHQACFSHDPWSAATITTLIEGAGAMAVMVESLIDGAPLGLALVRSAGGEGEILTFGVVPGFRQLGLGRSLLATALALLATANAEAVFLEVAADNAAALSLYHGGGFEQVGRRRGYYQPSGVEAIDALILKHNLDPNTSTAQR
ncbi:tRNA threonylcarbamoyladenosine biosynthesis protein TsaB [uncultured Gammaproteobacteria bacterium]